jgi:dipeptidyl-peptidase-4
VNVPISAEDIAHLPAPGLAVPGAFAYSADDRYLAFLHSPEGSLQRGLHLLDLDAGAVREVVPGSAGWASDAELPLGQRLLRERTGEMGLGVVGFAWAAAANRMLVTLRDGLYVLDPPEGSRRRFLAMKDAAYIDPQLSPDGRRCAFVQSSDLWVVEVDRPAEPKRLTSGGGNGISHGIAEYIAQSDAFRFSGFWWSPDGTRLAHTAVDERGVSPYSIPHLGERSGGARLAAETHRYPFAGAANAGVRLGVMPSDGGPTVWMDLGDSGRYLGRVEWTSDSAIYAQLLSRDHAALELRRLDPQTGAGATVHTDHSESWVYLHDDFRLFSNENLSGRGAFLWSSERSGFRHLELRRADGALARSLTSGAWMVDRVLGVDEEHGIVYFSGSRDGAAERHAYSVPLDGGQIRRITEAPGSHDVVVSHSGASRVDVYSSCDHAPIVEVRRIRESGATAGPLPAAGSAPAARSPAAITRLKGDARSDRFGLAPPELVTIEARDGTSLAALVYRPSSVPAPGIISVYGGPLVQRVVNSWDATTDMRAQALRQRGFCVLKLDNRGSARRGLEFEAAVRRHLGELEVSDQLDGVAWAVAEGLMDPERVGVYGWSYGGYMALRCMQKAPEVFKAAVAGAPVTSWDIYESHYTERYMGLPDENAAGYSASSVLTEAHRLTGRLLIIHGLVDENVHFRHSAQLIQALIAAGQDHDVLVLPEERHRLRQESSRQAVERRVLGFLSGALG